jgi:hypothetical protein
MAVQVGTEVLAELHYRALFTRLLPCDRIRSVSVSCADKKLLMDAQFTANISFT